MIRDSGTLEQLRDSDNDRNAGVAGTGGKHPQRNGSPWDVPQLRDSLEMTMAAVLSVSTWKLREGSSAGGSGWAQPQGAAGSLEHSEQRLGEAAETQRRAAGRGQPGPGMLLFTTKKLLICASGEGEGFS